MSLRQVTESINDAGHELVVGSAQKFQCHMREVWRNPLHRPAIDPQYSLDGLQFLAGSIRQRQGNKQPARSVETQSGESVETHHPSIIRLSDIIPER
jgi:hypothetical protein